jgi:hypothetical protein
MYVPKVILGDYLSIAPPVKCLTRVDRRDYRERRDLRRFWLNAGLGSNEGFAKRAIQLFGLFRVFGDRLE